MIPGGSFRSRVLKCLLFSLTWFIVLAGPAHARPINTISGWDGSTYVSSFGVLNTATYGETVTVATGATKLNSFSFEIGGCTGNVTFRGSVYAWDGTKATGPSLFVSPTMTVSGTPYQLVTISTGGITLPAGTYVLFASTAQDQTGAPDAACRWGAVTGNNAYAGGRFVFINNGPDPSRWTTSPWTRVNQDLAFQVDGLVPPAAGAPAGSRTSLLIGLAGLIAMGPYQLNRSRRRTA
jgi:hypothetical protein